MIRYATTELRDADGETNAYACDECLQHHRNDRADYIRRGKTVGVETEHPLGAASKRAKFPMCDFCCHEDTDGTP